MVGYKVSILCWWSWWVKRAGERECEKNGNTIEQKKAWTFRWVSAHRSRSHHQLARDNFTSIAAAAAASTECFQVEGRKILCRRRRRLHRCRLPLSPHRFHSIHCQMATLSLDSCCLCSYAAASNRIFFDVTLSRNACWPAATPQFNEMEDERARAQTQNT